MRSAKVCRSIGAMDAHTNSFAEVPAVVVEVVARLNKLDKTSVEIADAAGVEISWLKMLRRGKIPNPGIRQFQRVVAYLERVAA